MCPSLLLSAALIAPAAPVPPDSCSKSTGPAPRVLSLKADANGNVRIIGTILMKVTVTNTYFVIENNQQVQKSVEQDIVTSQYFNKTLADCNGKFMTASGTSLTVDEANNRLKKGATLLVCSDGKPVAKAWLRAADPETVVMVADDFAHAQQQYGSEPLPTTPAPQLAMLGTDDKGRVIAPCTSHPIESNGVIYYNEFGGKGFRGRGGVQRVSYGYSNPQATDATVVLKPLADVKFEAYTTNGKLVSRAETLKRLAAGGTVLVAGDNRQPDETYLKGFSEDTLVLVGPELVLPTTPLDKTSKKTQPAKDPKAQPLAPPLPGVKPIIGRVQIQGGLVAPAVQVKVK